MKTKFNEVLKILPDSLKISLNSISENIKNEINEIRLRANQPLTIYTSNDWFFVDQFGGLSKKADKIFLIDTSIIEDVIYRACDRSIYAHVEDIKNGFLTVKGGHRVGFCGTYTYENGMISGQKNISSVNIRIARQVLNSSSGLDELFSDGFKNILICGAPQSGKTTVLRDIIRKISNGEFKHPAKIVAIDERGEIAAIHNGISQNDVGVHTDIISFCRKQDGIVNAIRSLSPDIIACDEIGSDGDINALYLCSTCGVKVIATIHCNNKYELKTKVFFDELTAIFDAFVFLEGIGKNSRIAQVLASEEIIC